MGMPIAGEAAPEFELQTDTGETVRLSDHRGKKVVLFFYPKADTPGCIKEACGFRDDYSSFKDRDIVVLGISPDTVRSQADFSEKYGFPYPLLADADHKVAQAYGVRKPGKLRPSDAAYGTRTTFLIDEAGRISHVFEGVRPVGHSQEVFATLNLASS
ncbi:MAG: thioredoxin-dependent thiol peroxidase [Anaerolineae bacterium]|nr:MAG: thioredoxin-dependent thiol peroxidase [Anaerolineae bacterium]